MKKVLVFLTNVSIFILTSASVFSQSATNEIIHLEMGSLPDITTEKQPQKKEVLRVAGFQMEVTSSIPVNKATILTGIIKAADEGAEYLMTPEGSLSGYNSIFNAGELNTALDEVVDAARNANVGLMLGTCYKEDYDGAEKCWNQIRVYKPTGDLFAVYSKILRCSPVDTPGTGEMLEYEEGELLIFELNGIRFGSLVCNDLWATPGYTTMPNPYLALQLKQMGAQVILHAINSGTNQKYKSFHEASAELWASSLGVQILEVNAAKGTDPINAQSGLIHKDGKRTTDVPEIGQQFFVVDISN